MKWLKRVTSCCIGKTTRSSSHFSAEQGVRATKMKNIIILILVFISINAIGGEKMLHPDFPVIENKYQMTSEWSINLEQPYNRRIEEGSLVIWRPGLTIWVNIWNNDNNETIKERLKWIISESSPEAFEVTSYEKGTSYVHAYRLNEKNNGETSYSYNSYVLSENAHVQLSIYFDSESDFEIAKSLVDSIEHVQP